MKPSCRPYFLNLINNFSRLILINRLNTKNTFIDRYTLTYELNFVLCRYYKCTLKYL